MGMKKDGKYVLWGKLILIWNILAVQKERDRLGRQRNHNNYGMANIKTNSCINGDLDEDDLSVMALLRAEKTAQEVWLDEFFLGGFKYSPIVFSILVDKFI